MKAPKFRAVEIYAGHGEVQRFEFTTAGKGEYWRTIKTCDTYADAQKIAERFNAKLDAAKLEAS